MSTMQKGAILKKCLNIFVPHWNNLRSMEIGGQDFNTYHWNSKVHQWFSTKQRVHQVIVHLRNQWSYGSYKMRKLKVKDRRRQQKCHKKRKNVSKFSWAWIIKTVTKLRERERRIACLVFTSYIKCTTVHSIRKFQVIVVQWRQRIEMRRNVCRTPLFQSGIGMFFFLLHEYAFRPTYHDLE